MRKFLSNHYGLRRTACLMLILTFSFCSRRDELQITTKSPDALRLFLQARTLGENLYLQDAIDLLSKAIEADREFALAYLYRARFSGNSQKLKADLETAGSLSSGVSEGEKLLISAYEAFYGENNPEKAIVACRRLVQMFPRDSRFQWRLGVFYRSHDDNQSAAQHMTNAILMNPDFAPAYLSLGYLYRDMGDYLKAEDAFLHYADLIPDQPNPYDSLGDLCTKMGKFEEAIGYFEQALTRDPNFTDSLLKIGVNHIFQGKFEEGREAIQEAMARESTPEAKVDDFTILVRSYLYEQDFERALKFADELIMLADEYELPDSAIPIQIMKVAVLAEMKQFSEAWTCLKQCKDLLTDIDLASFHNDRYMDSLLFWEAILAAHDQDFKRALDLADRYRISNQAEQNPTRLKTHFGLLGIIEVMRGACDIACQYFQYADLNDPLIMYYAAKSAMRGGKRVEAGQLYRKLANWNEDGMWYAFVRKNALARK